jgi:hypothetical protein
MDSLRKGRSMTTQDFSTFLIYKASDAGRKVYIDPELIVTFAEYVDPTTESGGAIANSIQHKLSSTADGADAGQENGASNSYFMDFGEFTGHCVRVFYKIIQNYPDGMSKGPGVYIYNLRGFAHNKNNVGTGLFHMKHSMSGWGGTPASKSELKNKVLRIGSSQDDKGIFALDKLSNLMLEGAGQGSFKTDFDLYHSPLAVVEYGKDFTTPVARKVAQPSELAKVLESTATIYEWSDSPRHEKYTVYVYGQSAKLLADALRLVDGNPKLLEKFEFQLLSPHIPFSLVKTLAESRGATAVLNGNVQSEFSKRYQMLDEKSLVESDIAVFKKFEGQITNRPNSSFFDLWKCMKTTTHLLT